MRKTIVAAAVVLGMMLSVSGCGEPPTPPKKKPGADNTTPMKPTDPKPADPKPK